MPLSNNAIKFVESNSIATSTRAGIITPTKTNILLGRGSETNSHAANIVFCQLINAQKQKYLQSGAHAKKIIVKQIVQKVEEMDCQFLKQDVKTTKVWSEISAFAAKRKTVQASITWKCT